MCSKFFAVISSRFPKPLFVQTMNPTMVRHFKEKSIDASQFNWGIKNGKALAELLPGFSVCGGTQRTEGMHGVCANFINCWTGYLRAEYFQ